MVELFVDVTRFDLPAGKAEALRKANPNANDLLRALASPSGKKEIKSYRFPVIKTTTAHPESSAAGRMKINLEAIIDYRDSSSVSVNAVFEDGEHRLIASAAPVKSGESLLLGSYTSATAQTSLVFLSCKVQPDK